MLPKQLKEIKDHLINLQKLDDKQKQLLQELTFVEKNLTFDEYRYQEKIFESFAVASGTCPSCGKKM
jgi:Tfp pilus assembly protein PilN